jgi:hypothetical protein
MFKPTWLPMYFDMPGWFGPFDPDLVWWMGVNHV